MNGLGEDTKNIARKCIESMKDSVEKCEGGDAMVHATCAASSAEIAFHNKGIDRKELTSIKNQMSKLLTDFQQNCECRAVGRRPRYAAGRRGPLSTVIGG